jgi:uncharacterized protein YfaS (alpha-2-macroglobulin family)
MPRRALRTCGAAFALALLLFHASGFAPESALTAKDRLGVVLALPQGRVERWTAVTVVFDRPVVAMGAADPTPEDGRRILALDPQPDGHYRWLGTRTLSYVVPGGLPRGTRYRAVIHRGLTAIDGARLEKDSTWTFASPPPRLVSSFPHWGERLISPGAPIILAFDQAVDPAEVARHAVLTGGARLEASRPAAAVLDSLGYNFRGIPAGHLVRLDSRPPFVPDEAYQLTLDAGLRGTEGPIPTGSDTSVTFSTYPPLEVYGWSRYRSRDVEFTTPVNGDSLRRYLTIEPVPEGFGLRGHGVSIGIEGWIDPDTTYTVHIRKGLPDLFGQRMARDATLRIEPWHRHVQTGPVRVSPPTGMYLLGAPRHAVVAFGRVMSARLRARTVAPDRLPGQTDVPADTGWAVERTYPDPLPLSGLRDTLDLSGLVPPGKPGIVEVVADALVQAPGDTEWTTVGRRSILTWTDVAATARLTRDDGVVWVTRISNGDPVPGARVAISDTRSGTSWEGRTGADGLVRTPGRAAAGGRYPDLRVRVESRFGAATTAPRRFREHETGEPRFPLPHPHATRYSRDVAFLFGDRPLYRPGEPVHLAGLVRRLDARGIVASPLDSVWIRIGCWDRQFTADTSLALDARGGFHLDLFDKATPGLGSYYADVYGEPPDEHAHPLGDHRFSVKEYRVDPARVNIAGVPADLAAGDTLTARITGSYTFGAPIANGHFSWRLEVQPLLRPLPVAGFHLTPERQPEEGARRYAVARRWGGEGFLAGDGTASVAVPITPEIGTLPARVVFEASVRSGDRGMVAARAAVHVHPAGLYAGIGIDRTFLTRDEPASVRVAVFDAATAAPVPGVPVRVAFLRHQVHSVPYLVMGGGVRLKSEAADSVLEEVEIESGAGPDTLAWTPPVAGMYLVRASVTDGRGRVNRAEARVLASGRPPARKGTRSRTTLDLVTDRDLYHPGDTARVAVPDSLHGPRALLTVEREGILESRVIDLPLPDGDVAIPLGRAAPPNLFADLEVPAPSPKALEAGDENARPRFQEGLCELEIDASSRRLRVEATPDRDEIGPGDEQSIRLRVTRADGSPVPARVAVAVVDEAVLALRPEPVPDPFTFFYEPRGFDTWSSETREEMTYTEAAALKAGVVRGGGEPPIRRRFASTAYWNPSVLTGEDGRAVVRFHVPDDLTTFRVVAVADAATDLFGSGSCEFRTTRPLVVEPALPRFVVPGDTLELAATVTNRSGAALVGSLQVESDLRLGSTSTAVSLADGASGRYGFPTVVPASATDSVAVRFFVSAGSLGDAVETMLPVQPTWTEEAQAAAGGTLDSTAEVIALPEKAIAGSARVDITLASNILGEAAPVFAQFEHGTPWSLEEAASRTLAMAIHRSLVGADAAAGADDDAETLLARAVRDLQDSRRPDRGFRMGCNDDDWCLYCRLYALYALERASEAGAEVDTALIREELLDMGGMKRVFDTRRAHYQTLEDWLRKVPRGLAFFVGVELGRVLPVTMPEEYTEFLIGVREELGLEQQVFLALGLLRLGTHPEVTADVLREVESRLVVTADQATAPAGGGDVYLPAAFRSPVRATALGLLLASRAGTPERLRALLAHGLLSQREHGRWPNTQDDALALLALEAYEQTVPRDPTPFTARAELQGAAAPLLQHRFTGKLAPPARASVALASLEPGTRRQLEFVSEESHSLHYAALLRWKENSLNRAPREGGFSMARRVESLDGGDTLRVGDVAVVRILVMVPREVSFLALTDPLPSGLEAIQPELATTSRGTMARVREIPWEYRPLYASWEIHDSEVRAFANRVRPGVYEFRYAARVRAAGTFAERPAVIEAIYRPELRASSGSGQLVVDPSR